MSQEKQYELQPVQEQQIQQQQQPRYGGGGGGGERRGGGSDFSPEDVSQIFYLLQKTSEKYFWKESRQPIPEVAIRDLHRVVFSAIRKSTAHKDRLLSILRSMDEQANQERIDRGLQLTTEQMGDAIKETIERIKDCFLPTFPDE